ncbi:glycoside hydrolase family 3 protein [Coralloluteibacterium stylophorae]|uniref:Exo 1,3/1,4-beta-D-glucan glucohydrolase n=2 Tax=Coralloluteibacterium stylophorae TaxID=1776034 RepID=A0A8J7VQ93_9GAMM|nr:glycoside hydrolase family 3 protein [Coralloluteibacterium stylophorae]MBS7456861.1 exo 1,3/1,4-beta-D-glucan glucohydrolase [Coralloluteibacterium stylophorae]
MTATTPSPHRRRMLLRGALVLSLAGIGIAATCGAQTQPTPAAHDATLWPQPEWPFGAEPELEARITALMAGMSVEDKVGQLIQGDIASLTPEDVRRYRLGSVLAGGNSDPGGRYDASPAQWLALADAFYEASMDTSTGGHGIPILFGIDAVHGQSNVVGATLFPHNIGLGATRDADLMRRIGEITAVETRVTGMEWTFAPTVAVPRDDRWGRTYEGYSEAPEVVASFSAAMVEGLQGEVGSEAFLDGRHVASSVKHFLGDGGTRNGIDQGDTQVDEATLVRIHNAGYPPALEAGAQIVMASFNSWNGVKTTGNRHLLTDVLKARMNFGGFVVSDWNGHGQIPGCSNERCPQAFNAGLDMAMAPDSWKGMYDSTVAAVRAGTIPMARIDDAVRRVLRVKLRLGLFEAGRPSQRPLGGDYDLLGSPAHRAVAREAVRKSLVLLKNQGGVLPLDPRRHVLVAGDGADDVGKQSGGWTLNWQGRGTRRADFPNADSIFEGIERQVEAAGGTATLAVDGTYEARPDVAVVVFGEDPYAEFQGDVPTLAYKPGDDADLELIRRFEADGIPVVAVFLSGRPLWVNREINAADAFVAAWLPGSEGAGVADVLLRDAQGRVQHDFQGRLSFSWPRTAVQFENNVGQPGYDPQFAFGYGLTYADDGDLAPLPESPGITGPLAAPGVYFARGRASGGFSMRLLAGDGAQPVTSLPAASGDGHLRIEGMDHEAQEDAWRMRWSGEAGVALVADEPLDLTREANGDVMLVLHARRGGDAVPLSLTAGCGEGCGGTVEMQPLLARMPAGTWTRIGVPLKCLVRAGLDVARVRVPMQLETAGPLDLALSRVALGTQGEAEQVLDCSAD